MVRLENLTKFFWANNQKKMVADNISLTFPTGISVALLGRNGAGKSTLMQMIAGTLHPNSGQVVSDGTISWPVGFGGSFHRELTGAQNVKFIARIYGVDTNELINFVEDFAELGGHFHMPVRSYSSGMSSRLAFGTSMGIHFDTYLVDEVTAVGDAQFKRKSQIVFNERMRESGSFLVSHDMNQIRQFCDVGCVLEDGKITYFEDLEEAISFHNVLMQ